MSAESPRKHLKFVNNVVRPQGFSDKTVMENVVDFISDVVPQAYSGNQKVDDKEKILWMRFERSDINDISRNPDFTVGENKGIPLLLILGYSNGVQIWNIMPSGEAQEVYSVRQGPVRILRVLPTPSPGEHGHLEVVKRFLATDINVNKCNLKNYHHCIFPVKQGNTKLSCRIIKENADINMCTAEGKSPLFIACQEINGGSMSLPGMKEKIDINKCTIDHRSPLFEACLKGHSRK
ncbi:Breast carcinoma-amplified sequence 3,Breast carcinoma-amplified sequence 3 homolog [Mytilus edulis]|uniref:Breast carcinoma-amplified sequence 3,Breast carcinoma-amplified sequence 3 homolog n=1 Tax=Mytilus edulis TaxID=6550 RepID=A0A8S3VC81_MYTED|nr:Breast carcinoma-amplified sequence 3,Breast carcinoma-amplified sequence 3 homolog [Mytilus edulis]